RRTCASAGTTCGRCRGWRGASPARSAGASAAWVGGRHERELGGEGRVPAVRGAGAVEAAARFHGVLVVAVAGRGVRGVGWGGGRGWGGLSAPTRAGGFPGWGGCGRGGRARGGGGGGRGGGQGAGGAGRARGGAGGGLPARGGGVQETSPHSQKGGSPLPPL